MRTSKQDAMRPSTPNWATSPNRTGRRLVWDAPKSAFLNDTKANELVKTNYRAPWKLPKG